MSNYTHTTHDVRIPAGMRSTSMCYLNILSFLSTVLLDLYHHPCYHRGSVYCLSWSRNFLLASGSNDHAINLLSCDLSYSPYRCNTQGKITVHNGTVRSLEFLPNDQLISGGAGDFALKLSDCLSEELLMSYTGHSDVIMAVTSVSNTMVASGSKDKAVKLWDIRQQEYCHSLQLSSSITSLSAHGDHLASAQQDGSCTIHDVRTLKQLNSITPHQDECRSVR